MLSAWLYAFERAAPPCLQDQVDEGDALRLPRFMFPENLITRLQEHHLRNPSEVFARVEKALKLGVGHSVIARKAEVRASSSIVPIAAPVAEKVGPILKISLKRPRDEAEEVSDAVLPTPTEQNPPKRPSFKFV